MTLTLLTIVKNGLPWISLHYPELRRLTIPWRWHVVEGTALPEHCTSWCSLMAPGLSTDGTTEYLRSLRHDGRVVHHASEAWHGKIAMVNEPLRFLREPCVLLEVDSDELWRAEQLEGVFKLFAAHPTKNTAQFTCRYFLGPRVAIVKRGAFGNRGDEWTRAWRFTPGMAFRTHEPPVWEGFTPAVIGHEVTERAGLVFDHMAYATREQIEFKVAYYGSPQNPLGALYKDAVAGWERLQYNAKWPARVRDYLPFVNDESEAVRV